MATRWMNVAAAVVLGVAGVAGVRGAAAEDETMMEGAATRPSARAASGPVAGRGLGEGPGGMFERLRERADELGLSDEQKEKIKKIAEEARGKVREVMEGAGGDRQKVRRQVGEIVQGAFRDVRDVLTPEQQKKWREMAAEGPGMRRGGAGDRKMAGEDQQGMSVEERMRARRRASTQAVSASVAGEGAKVGEISKEAVDPASVELKRLADGKGVKLSTMWGNKPLVLVFGSYSCPNFREHAKAIDELQRKYMNKANFLLVYTREAHPVGGWEVQRNKDAEISVPAHKDEAARVAAAKQARGTLGISMPVVVDTMDDQAVRAFDAFPNGCVILGKEGRVIGRQKWAEARGIRGMLDEVTGVKATSRVAAGE